MKSRATITLLAIVASLATLAVCQVTTNNANNPLNLGERSLGVAFLIVAGTAALADVAILYVHAVRPPHPKFLLTWDHRLSIRAHAIAGGIETILGVVAWVTQSSTLAIATGVFALVQIAAAYYQTPGVFGMKGVTVPLYCAGISVHLFCAVNLVATGDIAWLERTWIALQTYAYVRIVFFLLGRTQAFRGSGYTVSVVLGGAITLPFVLGPITAYFLVGIVIMYLALYFLVMRPTQREWSALFVEHLRRSLVPRLEEAWPRLGVVIPTGLSPREEARLAFDHLDSDGSGTLDLHEMEPLLVELGVSPRLQDSFRHHHAHRDSTVVGFDAFFATLWLPSRLQGSLTLPVDASLTNEQKARIVFDFLDMDGSGYLDEIEIEILLLEWGVEVHEAQRTIRSLSGPDHAQYSFDDFYRQLTPIWRFGYATLTTDLE